MAVISKEKMTEYRPLSFPAAVQSIGHVLLSGWEPREFARLKVALENPLPEDATEHIEYQILVDHLQY